MDFPHGPVIRILHFVAGGSGSILGQETKIPQTVQHGTDKKCYERVVHNTVSSMHAC